MKMEHTFPAKHGFTGSAGQDMTPTVPGFKRGGKAHAEGAKAHYGKKSHVDHDGDHSMSKVSYDEHGFQMHKHGGKC